MSDSRRRRKVHNSGDSDDLSDSYDELNTTKETQSSGPIEDCHDSEYDTAGSESETESQKGVLRESGDGQEEEKSQKKLDDDEDRRNPQYIPKRGTFYEHDDRTAEEATENNVEPQVERDSKEKKVWKDKDDKWNHDRYNDAEQAPKSHEELIAVYGYDIRNEEGPPRARRRRRYGRGPNKYTRNWEDEDAYGKIAGNASNKNVGRKLNKTGEEFPSLGPGNKSPVKMEEPVISSAWYSNKAKPQAQANFPPLQPQPDNLKSKQASPPISQSRENKTSETTNQAWKKDVKSASYIQSSNGNNGGDDADKSFNVKAMPRDNNKRNVQESVSLVASRARGRGFKANTNNNIVSNRIIESKPKGRGPGTINPDNRRSNTIQIDEEHQLANDVKRMNIVESTSYHSSGRQNKHFNVQSTNQQRANTVPPRLQHTQQQQQLQQQQQQQQVQQSKSSLQDASANRPKRYSSLRQRPTIAEGPGQQNFPSPHGQHTFYPSQGYPQGHFEQPTSVAPPNAPMAGQPVIPLPPAPQPPSYAPPPPFLVPPPQFMPPPQTAPPSILNYVPAPNGPPFQPNYQGYQGYNPAPVQAQGPPPPQELFQPQGCTYYSPAQQQQQQQPVRRPTAAIPILPPPDNQQQYQSARNRTKITPQQHQQQEVHQQVLQKHHEIQQQQQLLQQQQQEHLQQLEFQQIKHQQAVEQSEQELQQQQQQERLQQLEFQQIQLEQEQQKILAQHEQEQQKILTQHEQQQQSIQYQSQEKMTKIEPVVEQEISQIPQEQKELRQFEEDVIVEQEQQQQQEIVSPASIEKKIIEIDDKLLTAEKLHNQDKNEENNETLENNVNIETKEIENIEEVDRNSVEIIEKNSTTNIIVEDNDLISEAPVKLNNAPVVDKIVPSSADNVKKNGETDDNALEKPIVEETAA
ncbi:transcription factor SPT20 homolog isoform X2 [Leptopilina boulardi]|uniref:transcription factor SPT20 homolog isoform X2 n=1 Tax=Leptopilina boulardi TaxID=63433 RepID=UPI0021F574D7|nr:transcription factor SPT20 homolog isoform X2 [Leptopilina boulardi]